MEISLAESKGTYDNKKNRIKYYLCEQESHCVNKLRYSEHNFDIVSIVG